jgi:hypothetical protein
VADSPHSPQALSRRTFWLVVAVAGFGLAAATAAGVVLAANVVSPGHIDRTTTRGSAAPRTTPPSAARVELELVGATNAAATAMAGGGTIAHASCVEGSPGSYACSFVRTEPGKKARTCAVAVLSWTPGGDSTYTVVTAGRVALEPGECGPVKKVLHVLGTTG